MYTILLCLWRCVRRFTHTISALSDNNIYINYSRGPRHTRTLRRAVSVVCGVFGERPPLAATPRHSHSPRETPDQTVCYTSLPLPPPPPSSSFSVVVAHPPAAYSQFRSTTVSCPLARCHPSRRTCFLSPINPRTVIAIRLIITIIILLSISSPSRKPAKAAKMLYQEVNSGEIMDLDEILSNFGLGSYQVTVCALMGLVLMYSNISPLSYAITASDLKYRCEIPECDIENPIYDPVWLNRVVPFKEKNIQPYKCLKYHYRQSNGSDVSANNTCNFEAFDVNSKEKCNKWVFGETERTIVNDFGIMCEENKWKLSMVGTINSIGQFVGIPLAGFISDKYGRKFILIIGSVSSAILGTARSFTTDYYSFLLFELLDSMASSGVYGATFVLGLELVSPKARVTVSTLMGCFYPMGAVIMGFAAYMILDWRIMLRVLYLPGLLILGYAWYVPESMRWLQTQNRIEEMAKVLSKVAKSNGKTLPSSVKEALIANTKANANATKGEDEHQLSCSKLLSKIFSSKEIFLRLINCSFCWTTITLVYYGLSLTSVEISGNKYLNFMLVNIVEVPAFLTSWYFMERFSRRNTQAFSFLFSGIGCIMVNVVPTDYLWVKLLMFLSSKYAITMAFNTMYVFTAEMFPTELRMSLFGIASMFGRMGSMFAPQMTLLSAYFGQYVPILLFGIISFMAGALAFLFPETKDQKLPDTVKQAEFVGDV